MTIIVTMVAVMVNLGFSLPGGQAHGHSRNALCFILPSLSGGRRCFGAA
jgi:hypothetical protein